MSRSQERYLAQDREDAAARFARRMERELRRSSERRRTAVAATVLVLALVVASVGSVAAVSGNGAPEEARTRAEPPVAVAASSGASAQGESDAAGQGDAAQAASALASPAPTPTAAPAAPRREAPVEPTTPATKPGAAAKPDGDILVRKCSGSKCHSVSEVSQGGLDTASAVGVIQAMTDNGYLRLTSAEREAVIAALTRK